MECWARPECRHFSHFSHCPTETAITPPFNDHIQGQMVMEGCCTTAMHSIWRVMMHYAAVGARWNILLQCPQGYPWKAKRGCTAAAHRTPRLGGLHPQDGRWAAAPMRRRTAIPSGRGGRDAVT